MRINYVAYFDPLTYGGGGEMIMRSIIETGRGRGHTFTISSVRQKRFEYDSSADIDFLADVFNYPSTLKSLGAWRDFADGFISGIASRRPFVHLNNAYVDICNLGYLPCSGRSANPCPHKSPSRVLRNIAAKDFSTTCFASLEHVRILFVRSRLNVFLSPLHQRVTYRVLGLDNRTPTYVMKPVIDGERFFNRRGVRDIEYLFVGVISEAKGLDAMRERFWDQNIHLIGKIYPGARLDFGTHHGHVPYAHIPEFMNRAKNFVFLPRWPEPQGRVVIEAALCGCNLITNENVGATSFPFDISRVENFSNATGEFWQTVESLRCIQPSSC
jgi:glycosyltransferase involved in cell wall biosynthesis